MSDDFITKKFRAENYKEACAKWDSLEKERLADFDNICERIRLDDRKLILEFIEVTADTLLVYDTLSPELRSNLASGLKEIVSVLKPAKGFLHRRRGEKTDDEKTDYDRTAELTALRVEYFRRMFGLTIDEAKAKVANDFGISESLVHKHWKHNKSYRSARRVFESLDAVFEICESPSLFTPSKKKVR